MKFLSRTILILFSLIIFENKSFALSDYQIKEICQKRIKRLNCIKDMKLKRSKLLKGNRIRIPVINFKK